ncbi:MAG: heat-inducible transcription repressor HrcA [Bacilli bacterium]|nr:heat-inducible transcription repressor HrcA [Bacilli bacterium]
MSLTRSEMILKMIVEYFIKTAEPVGSQTLIEEYDLPYSSATIRNEMSALEKMGYIEKPHTSAGRVPSSKGYEYYCKHLRDNELNENIRHSLQSVLDSKIQSVEEVIKRSCEIISHMTSLVSVVMGPDESAEHLANVQLVPINENTITAIFVTDKGYVQNKTFILEENIKPDEIVQCVGLLNERLKGTPITGLVEKMESIRPILSDYIVSHDVVYQAILESLVRFAGDRLSLYGREELFNHPEFKNDTEALMRVMKLLDDASLLKKADHQIEDDKDLSVSIGDIEGNPDVAIVTTKIKIGNDGENTITLVGPKRMDYDKALSALEYLSQELDKYFNDKGGHSDGGQN